MKTIVLVGVPDVGKSYCVYELAAWLSCNGWKDVSDLLYEKCLWTGAPFVAMQNRRDGSENIRQLFEKEGKYILLHAPMDDERCVEALLKNLEALRQAGIKVDLLVSTLRRLDNSQYNRTLNKMNWKELGDKLVDADGNELVQIPLLRVKYEWNHTTVVGWYNQKSARLLQILADKLIK